MMDKDKLVEKLMRMNDDHKRVVADLNSKI